MLILTRRLKQTIRIGADIHILVLGIKDDQVCIGVTAPPSVPVHREEVFERIARGVPPPRKRRVNTRRLDK